MNERSNLYRREHHKEAMVWQDRGQQPEPQDDDEDRQTDNELNPQAAMVSKLGLEDIYTENINKAVYTCSSMFLFRFLVKKQHHVYRSRRLQREKLCPA